MVFALRLAIIFLLLSFPVRAQEFQVATTLICDTQKQAERFATLFDGDAQTALSAVNAEENDPTACMFATMAFTRGAELSTVRTRGATYRVVELIVVAVATTTGVLQIIPTTYYSLLKVQEREI